MDLHHRLNVRVITKTAGGELETGQIFKHSVPRWPKSETRITQHMNKRPPKAQEVVLSMLKSINIKTHLQLNIVASSRTTCCIKQKRPQLELGAIFMKKKRMPLTLAARSSIWDPTIPWIPMASNEKSSLNKTRLEGSPVLE